MLIRSQRELVLVFTLFCLPGVTRAQAAGGPEPAASATPAAATPAAAAPSAAAPAAAAPATASDASRATPHADAAATPTSTPGATTPDARGAAPGGADATAATDATAANAAASPEALLALPPVCVIGEHGGISDPEAETATELVCEALLAEGVRPQAVVWPEQAAGREAYRLRMRVLGRLLLVDLIHERPLGHEVRRRNVSLKALEDYVVAAPRLARALVRNLPVEESAQVDNLVANETRAYDKKQGEFLFGFGVMWLTVPTAAAFSGFGALIHGLYETPYFGFGVDLMIGGATEQDVFAFAMSASGRYFFSRTNTSPYVGAGLGFLVLTVDEDGTDDTAGGPNAELILGVECFRLHETRLDVGLHVLLPFYKLDGYYGDSYEVPVSLGVIYAW